MRWLCRFKEINFCLNAENRIVAPTKINPNLSANSLQKHFRNPDKFFRLACEVMVGIGYANDLHAFAFAL